MGTHNVHYNIRRARTCRLCIQYMPSNLFHGVYLNIANLALSRQGLEDALLHRIDISDAIKYRLIASSLPRRQVVTMLTQRNK